MGSSVPDVDRLANDRSRLLGGHSCACQCQCMRDNFVVIVSRFKSMTKKEESMLTVSAFLFLAESSAIL